MGSRVLHYKGVVYLLPMAFIQTFLQTIWASLLSLGLVKSIIIVVVIALISRAQNLLGLIAALLFIAYLAGWL